MGIRELIEQQQQDGDRIGLSPQQIRTASEKQAFGSAPFIGRTLTDLIGKGVEIPTKLIAGAGEKLLEPSPITGRRAIDVLNPFTGFGVGQRPPTASEQLISQPVSDEDKRRKAIADDFSTEMGRLRKEKEEREKKEKETKEILSDIDKKPLGKDEFRNLLKSPETQKRMKEGDISKKSNVPVNKDTSKKAAEIVTSGLSDIDKGTKNPKEVAEQYTKEIMDLLPEFEGKSRQEKGLDLAKLGMAIAAGESPNAIQNIAKGFLAMGDTFTEDAKERRAFNLQMKTLAAKYTLDRIAEDRGDAKDFQYFYNQDGDMEILSKADLAKGKRPSDGYTEAAMAEVINNGAEAKDALFLDALAKAELTEPERKAYFNGYKNASELNRKAVLGQELTTDLIETLEKEPNKIIGIRGAAKGMYEKGAALFGVRVDNYRNEKGEITEVSRQQFVDDVRKVFQLMVPLTLGKAQSANSISDRDVTLLAKAAVANVLNDDDAVALTTQQAGALERKLRRAHDLFRTTAKSTSAEMESLDSTFGGKLIIDTVTEGGLTVPRRREASLIVDPFRAKPALDQGPVSYDEYVGNPYANVTDEQLTGLSDEIIAGLDPALQARAIELKNK